MGYIPAPRRGGGDVIRPPPEDFFLNLALPNAEIILQLTPPCPAPIVERLPNYLF